MSTAVAETISVEPRSVEECPDWPKWEEAFTAIIAELSRLIKGHGAWKVVDKPAGVSMVGSTWVFKVKKDAAAGNVEQ